MTRPASLHRRCLLASIFGAAARSCFGEDSPLRFGVSQNLVHELNASDARAAITVWIRRITSDLAVNATFEGSLFESPQRLEEKLRNSQLDAVGINILDYRQMAGLLDRSQVAVPVFRGAFEYVLLVPTASAARNIAALRGHRLLMLDSAMAAAAPAWLETLVGEVEPQGPGRFFSTVTRNSKPTQVMLPVFFRQAEACLTTQSSFVTMSELNPQVASRLRPLAVSPEIVPVLYAFRKGWQSTIRDKALRAFSSVGASSAGRQLMTLFQCENLVVKDGSCLDPSVEILAAAERLRKRNGGVL
ncbi:MAG: PhnD/SsuA/transferrin family substrate-binding protein [Acidobacteria bacterium]|nr:PhnD/SsuA/transferrin family substrate-binding protein [Acidobacteriota bacterium]